MAIIKSKKLKIEIQKQLMKGAGSKYLVLLKSENKNKNNLKILTTNNEPIIKFTEDNGDIIVEKKN